MSHALLKQLVENLRLHGLVHRAPVDVGIALCASSSDEILVLRRTPSKFASIHREHIAILGMNELALFSRCFVLSNAIKILSQNKNKIFKFCKNEAVQKLTKLRYTVLICVMPLGASRTLASLPRRMPSTAAYCSRGAVNTAIVVEYDRLGIDAVKQFAPAKSTLQPKFL